MTNVTNIPAPRVPFLDERTGLMSREWYRFFLNLFMLVGDGTNDVSLTDLMVAPQAADLSGQFDEVEHQAQLAALLARYDEVQKEIRRAKSNQVLTWLTMR